MNIKIMMIIIICFVICGCLQNNKTIEQKADNRAEIIESQGIKAMIEISDTHIGKNRRKVPIIFLLINGSKIDVRIDKQFVWPGTINLMIKLPNGKCVRLMRTGVKMDRPSASDLITLKPGEIHGCRLWFDLSDDRLDEYMTRRLPGRYLFWGDYHSPSNPNIGYKNVSLITNKITINIE